MLMGCVYEGVCTCVSMHQKRLTSGTVFCLIYSQTGSYSVSQAGLELTEICLLLPLSAGVKDMCHHTGPPSHFLRQCLSLNLEFPDSTAGEHVGIPLSLPLSSGNITASRFYASIFFLCKKLTSNSVYFMVVKRVKCRIILKPSLLAVGYWCPKCPPCE